MDIENLWDQFAESGTVKDYLRYIAQKDSSDDDT